MAGSPAEQQLMPLNDDANDVNVAGLNHEVNVETTKCMGYCNRRFTWIFETGPNKTKVLIIYAFISIIVILVLLSVVAHKNIDNNSPYSMTDNMDNEFLKLPCKVIDPAQYPPVQKESDDTCFYTKENITKILNATRKSLFKKPCMCNHTTH
ncbi:uncharacterized protein LOC127725520 [Mytilus californianus]|uniref:uncharacterized protein LOC127725520 n=1 Tax=Mytilus californianus TaxID=6549 RepID=UPI002245CD19|nr:uncharacterized protein LOC127725520 [Mytilus californianus]